MLAFDGSIMDLDFFKAPKRGSLGSPVAYVHLVTPALVVDFAFSASNDHVYTAEQGDGGLGNTYDFPSGGMPVKTITLGGSPVSVAVTPPLVP